MHGTHKQSCTSMNLSPWSHTKRTFTRYFPSQRRQHTHKPSWKCQRAQKRHDHTSTFLWHCINSLPFPFTADEALALARNSHWGYSSNPNRTLALGSVPLGIWRRQKHVRGESSARLLPEQPRRRSGGGAEGEEEQGSVAHTRSLPHDSNTPTTPEYPFPTLKESWEASPALLLVGPDSPHSPVTTTGSRVTIPSVSQLPRMRGRGSGESRGVALLALSLLHLNFSRLNVALFAAPGAGFDSPLLPEGLEVCSRLRGNRGRALQARKAE